MYLIFLFFTGFRGMWSFFKDPFVFHWKIMLFKASLITFTAIGILFFFLIESIWISIGLNVLTLSVIGYWFDKWYVLLVYAQESDVAFTSEEKD